MSTGNDERVPRDEILEHLRRQGAMTIDALVQALSLSKTATRAHILKLEEQGLIQRSRVRRQGSGRPPVAFELTERGGAFFPTQDDTYLRSLLEFLEAQGHESLITQFFQDIWSGRHASFASRLPTGSIPQSSLEERLSALVNMLAEDQFMPEVERCTDDDGDVVIVRECNCPIPAAARATRIPCALEAEFLEDVVGGRLRRASFANDRTQVCTFEFVM